MVNLSNSAEQYVIKRFKEGNRSENKVRKGRPIKLTKRDERFIIRKFVQSPHLSAVKVTAKLSEKCSSSVSPETVRRVLRTAGLNGHSAHRKFFVSAKSRKLRLLFTKSMINSKHTGIMFHLQSKGNLTFLVLMVVEGMKKKK